MSICWKCACCCTNKIDVIAIEVRFLGYCSKCIHSERCCRKVHCQRNHSRPYCNHCVRPEHRYRFIRFANIVEYLQSHPDYDIGQSLIFADSKVTFSWVEFALQLPDFALLEVLLSARYKNQHSLRTLPDSHTPLQLVIAFTDKKGLDFVKQLIYKLVEFGLVDKKGLPSLFHSPFLTALDLSVASMQSTIEFLLQEGFAFPSSRNLYLQNLHPTTDKDKILWLAKTVGHLFDKPQKLLSEFVLHWYSKRFTSWIDKDWHTFEWLFQVLESGFCQPSKPHHNELLHLLLRPELFELSYLCGIDCFKTAIDKLQTLGLINTHCPRKHSVFARLVACANDKDALELLDHLYTIGFTFDYRVFGESRYYERKFIALLQRVTEHQPDFDCNGANSSVEQVPLLMSCPDNVLWLLQMGAHPNYQTSQHDAFGKYGDRFGERLLQPVILTKRDTYNLTHRLHDSWQCWVYLFVFGFRLAEVRQTRDKTQLQNSFIYQLWRTKCCGVKSLFILTFEALHREHVNFSQWKPLLGLLTEDILHKRNSQLTLQAQENWNVLSPLYT